MKRALIIANSEYQDSSLERLRAPPIDAEELASVLGDPDIGGFEINQLLDNPEAMIDESRYVVLVVNADEQDEKKLSSTVCFAGRQRALIVRC
jgi:hypothetical protein